MGTAKIPHRVKLITGIITSSEELYLMAANVLQRKFGLIDYKSQIIPFDFTDYYRKEMGSNLIRGFLGFEKLINPASLPNIKNITNRLEQNFANKIKTVRRAVNIDPGYITDGKLILATTKDYHHRIYLDKGIYAEVTLYFRNGTFRYWDWAYPDYKTDKYINIFNQIRCLYMQQKNHK